MAVSGKRMTAEDLWQLPDDGMRHELVYGELRTMTPSGAEHGRRTNIVNTSLGQYVGEHGQGVAYGAETGFLLARDPDLVRAPDAAFVSKERAEAAGTVLGYWPGAPDLAVEVVSPYDRPAEVEEKVATWLAHGTRMVVIVYPIESRVRIHRPGRPPRDLSVSEAIDGEDVLPGWRLPLAELFA
jgi:Uma2 family endonuclease